MNSGSHRPGWAWVAGASEGLGLAFAEELAERGYDLVLIARRGAILQRLGTTLAERCGVQVVTHAQDLAAETIGAEFRRWAEATPPQLAVYNAAYAPVGAFTAQSDEDLLRVLSVNVRGPLLFARILGGLMAARGSGQLLLMSSLAGLQGSPRVATYAASKAFNTVLAEGLWHELRARGVDVHVCCAGAIRTPAYLGASDHDAPGAMEARAVVRAALGGLGGGPRIVPGAINRLAELVVGRWLPRRSAIRIMSAATRDLRS